MEISKHWNYCFYCGKVLYMKNSQQDVRNDGIDVKYGINVKAPQDLRASGIMGDKQTFVFMSFYTRLESYEPFYGQFRGIFWSCKHEHFGIKVFAVRLLNRSTQFSC